MAGADASAIYEQFAHTPLKIRPSRATTTAAAAAVEAPPSDNTDADGAHCDDKQHRHARQHHSTICEKDIAVHQTLLLGAAAAAASPSPSGPTPPLSPTRKELRKLQCATGSLVLAVAKKSSDSFAADTLQSRSNRTTTTASQLLVPSHSAPTNAERTNGKRPQTRSTARAPRTVKRLNQRVAAKPLATCTPVAQPAKRRRTTAVAMSSATTDATAAAEVARSESRSLLAAFVHCVGDSDDDESDDLPTPQKLALVPPKRCSRRIQLGRSDADMAPDFITDASDVLLQTATISGALFCVALNALRPIQDEVVQQIHGAAGARALTNPFETVRRVCIGIATCEQLAAAAASTLSHQSSTTLMPSLLTRRRGSKATQHKKRVRFQRFDLSCLSLEYVHDAATERTVDDVLSRYDSVMIDVAILQQRVAEARTDNSDSFSDSPAAAALQLEARVVSAFVMTLSDRALLFATPELQRGAEAERVFLAAFGARDSHAQHELETSRLYYAREFAKLVSTDTAAGRTDNSSSFLESTFSRLVSSSVRFKLRALFLEFDTETNESSTLPIALYPHQDLGSAVHCALHESLLFAPLITPLLALVGDRDRIALLKRLENVDADDLAHIEQFALAQRFLQHHVTRAFASSSSARGSDGDSDSSFAATSWAKIEQICGIAKRHGFEDEAHLFPLADVRAFLTALAQQERTLQQLEQAIGDLFAKRAAHEAAAQSSACGECSQRIARPDAVGAIACITCAGVFHLRCLHLPPSFAQFAGQYTCPSCFLGRRR